MTDESASGETERYDCCNEEILEPLNIRRFEVDGETERWCPGCSEAGGGQ